jgi:ubiquitin thioesterase OTU1
MLLAAKKLADILRGKKAYTNTTTFDLKCEVRTIVALPGIR